LEQPLKYIIITPARNEAEFIEVTLQSVVSQTVAPAKWIIVSDGSTDGTDDIVRKYSASYPWIDLIRMPDRTERDFAAKVKAFNAGYERIRGLDYDVVVSLDGDISFEPDYMPFLLEKLAADAQLGLVGTPFKELSGDVYDYRFVSLDHVSGACQVFRRKCFEEIGGYKPVKGGSIDHIAVISARMAGWKTRTYPEKTCLHHRKMGTAQRGVLHSKFKLGVKDYTIGNHPAWEIFRVLRQLAVAPRILGGVALGAGFFWATAKRAERPVSREFVKFHRKEQMNRLFRFMRTRGRTTSESVAVPAERSIAKPVEQNH
jgi:glycosyltransferase involved in cell wall biosynthesis